MDKIIIVGYGGHSKSMVDAIETSGEYEIVGFVDKDMKRLSPYRGYSVIGTDDDYEDLYNSGIRFACIGIGHVGQGDLREHLFSKLTRIGFSIPTIVDPTAVMATDVIIGDGCFIGKNAVVNSEARIGGLSIINTAAIVEHECVIGSNTHIAVATTLCGGVHIGDRCFIGANSTIVQGIRICDETIVGGGSVVINNIEQSGTYVGVPARKVK